MPNHCISILFFLLCSLVHAQQFKITGTVVDSLEGRPLEAATIYSESFRDSTLIAYTISDASGYFELEGRTGLDRMNLFLSHTGYRTMVRSVKVAALTELGAVRLAEQAQELQGVDVVGERVPITIKNDTVEFNADSFKTRPDATVEEVLKQLPGVEIASDGTITVNGKEVNQVLVDGQVFFSTDPKVATKSLPKDIISKIQITDTKSNQQEFTGEAGDGDAKTINLTLKEDKKKGFLARLSGGYGTDDRYQTNGLFNYFNDSQRISFIGGSNNINNSGFSFDEIYEMVGNARNGGLRFNRNGAFAIGDLSFGFGEGIVTSSNFGASYADQRNGRYKVGSNYFYTYSDSYNDEKIARENILPDGRFFTDTESRFTGSTIGNLGSANLEFDIDSLTRINLQPTLSVNRTYSETDTETLSTDPVGELLNSNQSFRSSDGMQRSFVNRMEVMRKLDTLGGLIRLYFDNANRITGSEDRLNAVRTVFDTDPEVEVLDQRTEIDNAEDRYELGGAYRHTLRKDVFLQAEYAFARTDEKNRRSVEDFDALEGGFQFNPSLSSDFEFDMVKHQPSLSFQSNGEKLRFQLRARLERYRLENRDFIQDRSFSRNYSKLLFNGYASYTIDKSKRFGMNYFTQLRTPEVDRLQPVPDVSNPLNIVVGNPELVPEIIHYINVDYNNYNWQERTGFLVYMGLNLQEDRIAAVSTTDSDFIRTTTYRNTQGNYSAWAGLTYSKQIKKDSLYTFKFTINPYMNLNNQVGFTNGRRLEARILSLTPRVGLLFNYKEAIEVEPEYRMGINATRYNLDNVPDIDFNTHNLSLKVTTYWPENLVWGNDLVYSYNGNLGAGFDKDALFWNMSLGYQFLKKKATFKVLAFDLLNQNINTRRTTGQDFIQDFQGTALQRYFMASLTLKFDSFGGSGPPDKPGGPRFISF